MQCSPIALSQAEWDELAQVPFVEHCLTAIQKGKTLRDVAAATKFSFESHASGPRELFVLTFNKPGSHPFVFVRRDGAIKLLDVAF